MIGKKSSRGIVLALALGGASAAFNACAAAEKPPLQTPEQLARQIPACHDVDGRPVTFIPVSESRQGDGQDAHSSFLYDSLRSTGALAMMDPFSASRVPVIVYNTDILGRVPEAFSRFVFLHECFHHTLGHVKERFSRSRSFRPSKAVTDAVEEEADCHAIREMVRQKRFGRREVQSLPENFRRQIAIAWQMFPEYLRRTARVDEHALVKRFSAQKACYSRIPVSP